MQWQQILGWAMVVVPVLIFIGGVTAVIVRSDGWKVAGIIWGTFLVIIGIAWMVAFGLKLIAETP